MTLLQLKIKTKEEIREEKAKLGRPKKPEKDEDELDEEEGEEDVDMEAESEKEKAEEEEEKAAEEGEGEEDMDMKAEEEEEDEKEEEAEGMDVDEATPPGKRKVMQLFYYSISGSIAISFFISVRIAFAQYPQAQAMDTDSEEEAPYEKRPRRFQEDRAPIQISRLPIIASDGTVVKGTTVYALACAIGLFVMIFVPLVVRMIRSSEFLRSHDAAASSHESSRRSREGRGTGRRGTSSRRRGGRRGTAGDTVRPLGTQRCSPDWPPAFRAEGMYLPHRQRSMHGERVCVCVLLTGETSRRSVLYYWRIQRSTCVLFVPVSVLHPLLLSLTCCRPRCCGRW